MNKLWKYNCQPPIYTDKLNIHIIEKLHIDIDLRKSSDNGLPITEVSINHRISKLFLNIAKKIIKII